jgi:hypothetical protein
MKLTLEARRSYIRSDTVSAQDMIDTHRIVIRVAAKAATPATIITALPKRSPVPWGGVSGEPLAVWRVPIAMAGWRTEYC